MLLHYVDLSKAKSLLRFFFFPHSFLCEIKFLAWVFIITLLSISPPLELPQFLLAPFTSLTYIIHYKIVRLFHCSLDFIIFSLNAGTVHIVEHLEILSFTTSLLLVLLVSEENAKEENYLRMLYVLWQVLLFSVRCHSSKISC